MGKLFSTPLRRGTNSLKWDLSSQRDVIPLWVADMDFTAPPAVIEAVQRRAGHGVFGYTYPGRSYFSAYAGWMQRRHGCRVSPRELLFAPGVMPLLRVALSLLAPPGGKVVVPEPVYYPFFSAVQDNGMQLVSVGLVQDSDGRYVFDMDSLASALQGADALLLCSPQNPVGRVWTEQELKQVLTAAAEAGTAVLVDEIHQDILYPGVRFV
ncbi:MAG: aminotransferase class I/II-fold pyridoxal phosphate-dependent enzyme, partial [Spirochaeta sp.]